MNKRAAGVALAVACAASAITASVAARHDDGLTPIVPWHHPEGVEVTVGESNEFGTRWGACTRGLAQAAARGFKVVVEVDGSPIQPAGWSRPVNPTFSISNVDFPEECRANSHREYGWWVIWAAPVRFDSTGEHSVEVTMTATHSLHDGAGFDVPAGWSISREIPVDVVGS